MENSTEKDNLNTRICGAQHPSRPEVTCENVGNCYAGYHRATTGEPGKRRTLYFSTKKASDGETPIATCLANLLTFAQLEQIKKLSAELSFDEDEVSHIMFGCTFEELSKSGASDVISRLEAIKQEGSSEKLDSKI